MNKLGRRITLLILPPDGLPSWRLQLSLRALAAALVVWTAMTLWAGASAMRRADYWATKADNALMRQRMARLLAEMERSRADFDRAEDADRQLRQLLGMPSRRAIIETGDLKEKAGDDEEGLTSSTGPFAGAGQGGPLPEDRAALVRGLAQERVASFHEIASFIASARVQLRATPMGWPAPGHVTSRYGYRHSPMGDDDEEAAEFHPGLDIANKRGTPIRATADGVVERAGWAGGYGRMILVRHDFGYHTLFGHAQALAVVVGQRVKRGDVIAYMGTTGRSTGYHVHYEVWKRGRTVNPAPYLAD